MTTILTSNWIPARSEEACLVLWAEDSHLLLPSKIGTIHAEAARSIKRYFENPKEQFRESFPDECQAPNSGLSKCLGEI